MPRKLKLDIDFSSDITLIAISCHKPNFWLALQLNNLLGTDLRRLGDLPYYHSSTGEVLQYPLFYYADDNTGLTCFFLGNHNPDGKLFTEYRAADFFLMVNDEINTSYSSNLIKQIKSIKGVLTAFEGDKNKIKNLKNFISDLELHMIEELKNGHS